MRVLVLTASYGSGHNQAARALVRAFERAGAETVVVDHFRELVHPRFERWSRALYDWMLRHARATWGAAYELGDRIASDSLFAFGATRLGTARLGRLLETLAPNSVVTVHATPAVVMSSLVAAGGHVPPHTTVVTDFVAHNQWIASGIDRYCVAADEVRYEFIARGIPPERIVVTGVPVRAEFEEPLEQADARARLGLPAGVPVVLAMAGSDGTLGRLPDVARALAGVEGPLAGLIVAGRGQPLAEKLRRIATGHPLQVFDHVTDVRTLMAAADLLITKAGGMTIAEALAAGLPLVLYGSLPGQERRNERFASRAGIALVARSRRELARTIERVLADRDLGEHLRHRIGRLYRPGAATQIVQAVLEGLPARRTTARGDASGEIRGTRRPR